MLDDWAELLIDRGLTKAVTVEEAIDALKRSGSPGLVHTMCNIKHAVSFICNCCPYCCFVLRGVTEVGYKNLASSRFRAFLNREVCTGCGECLKKCNFRAIEIDDQNVAGVIKGNCFGCGFYCSDCLAGAISMIGRDDCSEPYETGKELLLKAVEDKERLNLFLEDQGPRARG